MLNEAFNLGLRAVSRRTIGTNDEPKSSSVKEGQPTSRFRENSKLRFLQGVSE